MRTLDDIIPPSRRKENDSIPSTVAPPAATDFSKTPLQRHHRFPYITLLIALIIIVISIGALFYFSSAKVEVTPNTISASIQNSYTANQGSSNGLAFEVVSAQKIATQSVQGSGSKTAYVAATGSITVYNTSGSPVRLVANTRFSTPSGLIFRIRSAVVVPAGTTAQPGSVNTAVVADQTGSSYNIPASSFTVPGLAGTSQANEVYARSSAAMTGGVAGSVPVVDPSTEAQTTNALSSALSSTLTASLQTQIPPGYVLLPGAATTTYTELPPTLATSGSMVNVQEQGTIIGVVFPSSELAATIAATVPGSGYNGEPLTLATSSELTLTSASIPTSSMTSFSFTLSGTAVLEYTVDPVRIAAAIAGKTRAEAEVALTNYPEVKRAVLILRPFWRKVFPEDPTAIAVSVTGS